MSKPQRAIYNDDDLAMFLKSPAKDGLLRLTSAMGKSCSSESISYEYDPSTPLLCLSPSLASLHGSLRAMLNWMEDFPPLDRSMARFGNPAFKQWHQRLTERSISIVYNILKYRDVRMDDDQEYDIQVLQSASDVGYNAANIPKPIDTITNDDEKEIIIELVEYLHPAFGHEIRLDYGTGHECSFQVFLLSLGKLGCFGYEPQQAPSLTRLKAITISIWSAYLKVTRQIQEYYILEPAGSHGVWGLDDYHCLPFYFGACQMQSDGEEYDPASIHDAAAIQRDGDRLLYFGCIRYIKSLKKGAPFFESSPMLNDISRLSSWSKVASGLLRLFEGEVLSKRQVVQHFLFGNIFEANWIPSQHTVEVPIETFRDIESTTTVSSSTNMKTTTTTTTLPPPAPGGISPTRAPWAK